MKYNPAFLTDDQLAATFVVRTDELALLSQWLRAIADGETPSHILLLGQRGSGKTTLVRRVALEIRNDPFLTSQLEPVVLHEELFEVSSFDDLWREVDFHRSNLATRARPSSVPGAAATLPALASQFRHQKKRLLLFVENFYSLMTEQFAPSDVDLLKQCLRADADWLTIVGTTTASVDELQKELGRSIQLFRQHELSRLGPADCARLITSVTKQVCERNKIRPIEILTGGNPRLVSIMATFAQTRSLRQLMQQLTHLIDEHTSYFKSNLESLPPHERRVFVALAGLWTPSSNADVARASGLDVNRTSVYLTRLASRGLVHAESNGGKGRRFQVAERLYNIYYLLRRSGQSAIRVRALVDFMLAFYTPEETMASVSHEACEVDATDRETYFLVAETLLGNVAAPAHAQALISAVDPAFFEMAPASFRAKYAALATLGSRSAAMSEPVNTSERDLRARLSRSPRDVKTLIRLANKLATTPQSKPAAISYLKKAAEIAPKNPDVLFSLASLQYESSDSAGTVRVVRQLLDVRPEMASAWLLLAVASEAVDDVSTAEEAYRRAADLQENDWSAQFALATFLHERLRRTDAAIELLRKTIQLKPNAADPYLALADLLEEKQRAVDAETVLLDGLSRLPNHPAMLHALGHLHYARRKYGDARLCFAEAAQRAPSAHLYEMASTASRRLGLLDEAEQLAQQAVRLKPNDSRALIALAEAVRGRGDFAQAERYLSRAIAESPNQGFPHHLLGHVYEEQNRWSDAEIAFRDAVKRSPNDEGAWRHLAISVEHLGRHIDARELYRRGSLAVTDEAAMLFAEYLRLAAYLGDSFDSVSAEVETFLHLRGRNEENLDQIARTLLKHTGSIAAPMAERLAREAAFSSEGGHDALLTLCESLLAQSKWADAMKYVAAVLSDYEVIARHHTRVVRLMIRLSAFVDVARLHMLLGQVDDASLLAPLRTAFELILGHRPTVPQEIYLVAEDVRRAIEAATITESDVFAKAPAE